MKWRVNLAMLMGLVAVLALGLALLKVATDQSARVVFGLGLLSLLIATLGAFIRRQDRAPWIGFSLFGWVYATALLVPPLRETVVIDLPGRQTLYDLVNRFQPVLPEPVEPSGKSPSNILVREDSSGWHYRQGGQNLELTTEEWKPWAAYLDRKNAHDAQSDAAEAACRIALTFLGLTFAVLGSGLGLILDRPARLIDRHEARPIPGPTA